MSHVSRIYLWFDSEFTDLDPTRARLLQVALIATDAGLNRLTPPDRDLNLIIRLEPDQEVSPWVQEHLGPLLDRCRSEESISTEEADARLVAYVTELLDRCPGEKPVIAGNSVHADLIMARRFLPRFSGLLHYRLLDVTTLKMLWQDQFGGEGFDKDNPALVRSYVPWNLDDFDGRAHDAGYDILASVAELNFYRKGLGWG